MNTLENFYTIKQAVQKMVLSSNGANSYQYCRKILNQLCLKKSIAGACKVGSYWLIPKSEVDKLCALRYTSNS